MEQRHLSFSVPSTARAVTDARHRLLAGIRGWGLQADTSGKDEGDLLGTVGLVATELLANSVQHAGPGPISVTARVTSNDTVRIEVTDTSSALPHMELPDSDSEHGRGLFLVATLAARHDVEATASGKCCWAEISLPVRPTASTSLRVPLPRS
ncbi:ATP-binding protein [Streptomyces sp. NPDC003006]